MTFFRPTLGGALSVFVLALAAPLAAQAPAEGEDPTPGLEDPAAPTDDAAGETAADPPPEGTEAPVGDPAVVVAEVPARDAAAYRLPMDEILPPPERLREVEADDAPEVRVEVAPGRGLTVSAGDTFSTTLRARMQLRDTIGIDGDEVTNAIELRALRVWWTGHVLDPHVRWAVQLALGPSEFEAGNPSPIFDAFVEFTHLRDLQLRVGQYFVPFDRARTIRESALQTTDRTQVVRELTLDRDIGVTLGSDDLGGLGWLGYRLSVFAGDGRNRLGARDFGLLYVARVFARPFGAFDDDREGDLARDPAPRLAVGLAAAVDHNTDRPRATTGTPYAAATFDTYHLAADAVFKMYGVYFLGEVVWRGADRGLRESTNTDGEPVSEWSRSAIGYVLQLGVMVHDLVEVWARWDHLEALGETDPQLVAFADAQGHELSAGTNLYVNEHSFKVQLDWTHAFGARFTEGSHFIRLQLDASF